MIVFALPDGKLVLKVLKRVEFVSGKEVLVIFPVTALDFAVVPWRVGLNEFMLNAKLLQCHFK